MDFNPTAKLIRLAHGELHACFNHPVEPVAVLA
jgi:hypothetical protein